MEYGLLAYDPNWLDSRCKHDPSFHLPSRCDSGDLTIHTVYTDGSASFLLIPAMTHAAGAYVVTQHSKVTKSFALMLPGPDQSPFRAEVWAIILALRDFTHCHLHIDCAAAICVLQNLLHCRSHGIEPCFHDHHDLWTQVWKLLLTRVANAVTVTKVKAHQKPDELIDLQMKHHAKMNNAVDAKAKKCVQTFLKGKKALMNKEESRLQYHETMLLEFHRMWCEMNTECLKVIVRETCHSGTMPAFTLPFQMNNSFQYSCQLPQDVLEACPLGFQFAIRLQAYFHGMRWDHQQSPTSCLELYIDYSLHTGTVVPIKVDPDPMHPNVEKFELPDMSVAADSFNVPLVVQSRTWVRAVKWLIKVWEECPMEIQHQCKGALSVVGYSMPMCCVKGAPCLRMQTGAREHLWNYFHVNGRIKNNMSRRWHPPKRSVPLLHAQAGA